MPEKPQQLVIDALQRAVVAGNGIPLFGSRNLPGLFATSAGGKKAAELCREHGYLQVLRTDSKGKTSVDICAISEKGLAFLLAEQSPKLVLESLVRALEQQCSRVDDIANVLHANRETLEALKMAAQRVLQQIHPGSHAPAAPPPAANGNGKPSCNATLLERLHEWHDAGALGDCPLPNLYRHAGEKHPHITIGQFHDVLRQLHHEQKIYLHPWTGPMYEIPDPKLALMVGHEIAWYASLR